MWVGYRYEVKQDRIGLDGGGGLAKVLKSRGCSKSLDLQVREIKPGESMARERKRLPRENVNNLYAHKYFEYDLDLSA
jgi:hypothetical protein